MKFKVKKGASVVQNGSLVKFTSSEFETDDKALIEILEGSIVAEAAEPKPKPAAPKAEPRPKSKPAPKKPSLDDDEDF